MERPNTKQLEQALCFADTGELSEAEGKWLAAEVRALREELASENSEARRIFTREFEAELLERTQECDRLREERAWCGTNHGNNMCQVGLQKVRELQATIARVEELAISWGYDPYAKALKAALRGEP